MNNLRIFIAMLLSFFSVFLNAQNERRSIMLFKNSDFNVSLNPIHQDFFKKAFSYQGIEADIVFTHQTRLGVYAATFISNFATQSADKPKYVLLDISTVLFFCLLP